MANFAYVAVDRSGKEIKGTIEAENKDKAIALLKKKDLTVASVNTASVLEKDVSIKFLEKKPKARDLSVFCRQFVAIINAGVSIIQALDMLSNQTSNKRLQRALRDSKVDIEKGETLSSAMSKHKDVFNDLFVTMAAAGEASGSLDTSFERMAEQNEKDAKLKATVKKSLTYPVVVLIVAVIVVIFMLVMVIPRFQAIFDQVGGEMPGLTLAVVAASNFIKTKWYILAAIIILIVVGFRAFKKTEVGKTVLGGIVLKIPLLGPLIQKSCCARMARTLSSLIGSGISYIEAISITASTMTNIHYQRALEEARDDVAMGNALSESLKRTSIFPPMVYQMVAIGEETGDIEDMLKKLADYYEEEVETATAQVMAALEPMIIIVLALVVGTIVLACILPMLSMYSALDSM